MALGRLDGRLEQTADAQPTSYTDGKSGRVVRAYHAKHKGLQPDTAYLYAAMHDGAEPEFGTFRTAPRGRAAFTFTSFGDQGTPTLGRKIDPPAGTALHAPLFVNDNLGSPAAGDTTLGVERLRPLFHLFNGDLCYANLAEDRVRTWWDFWENNTRSARNRPWMPSPGNHENELGNGPIGYQAYPDLFFRAGGGRPDRADARPLVCLHGRLGARHQHRQRRRRLPGRRQQLRQGLFRRRAEGVAGGRTRRDARQSRHRLDRRLHAPGRHLDGRTSSMARISASARSGCRLFDKYGVDLVVCGHEHHYERSHPIRGQEPNRTLTPVPQATALDVIDTTKGTVHMVIGGGGTSAPSNELFFNPPQCRVIVSVGVPDPVTGKRPPVYVRENATWSAVRNAAHAYGFAAFTVDPGPHRGGETTIKVAYYDVVGPGGEVAPFETFTLRRPRRD